MIAKPISMRAFEKQRALKLIAEAIIEQVARCEAAERVVEEIER